MNSSISHPNLLRCHSDKRGCTPLSAARLSTPKEATDCRIATQRILVWKTDLACERSGGKIPSQRAVDVGPGHLD